MKCYFFGGAKGKGDYGKKHEDDKGDGGEKDDGFPVINNCFMIFDGLAAYNTKRQCKLEHRDVYAAEPAMPAFLNRSGAAITFDHDDHPVHVPELGRYPLVVDPIIGNAWLTKVLMDRDSGLNIMYAKTIDAMEIDQS
jgi:hypothetical protein